MPIAAGVSLVNGIIYDNRGDGLGWDFAAQCGEYRISRPIKEQPAAMVVAVEHEQLRANWLPQANNTPGPVIAEQQTYLVDETELIDWGAGIVKWDRIYATIPYQSIVKGSAVKTFKYVNKLHDTSVSPPALVEVVITSQTKTITCDVYTDYALNSASLPLPFAPDITTFVLGGQTYVWPTGGFPFSNAQVVEDNEYYSFITGEIGIYMGSIYYRKMYYGST